MPRPSPMLSTSAATPRRDVAALVDSMGSPGGSQAIPGDSPKGGGAGHAVGAALLCWGLSSMAVKLKPLRLVAGEADHNHLVGGAREDLAVHSRAAHHATHPRDVRLEVES